MNVFLSWSGDTSRRVAELLRDWMPTVIQPLTPWISSRDIPSGQRWFDQLADTTNRYKYGVFCLTPDNIESKWINFEAGALATNSEGSRVVGLLLKGLSGAQITGPLGHFHHITLSKEGMQKLMGDINSTLGERMLSEQILCNAFEGSWPTFEGKYQRILANAGSVDPVPERPTHDILKEILQIARDLRFETRNVPKHVQRTLGYVEAQYRQLADDMKKAGRGFPPIIKQPPIHAMQSTAYADGTTKKREIPSESSRSDLYD